MGWIADVDFKESSVHGFGVFARRDIAAGERVWQYDDSMHVCDRASLSALSPSKLRFALHGGYLHKPSDRFLWYTDGMQYMNHAATPMANVGLGWWPSLEEDHTVALRDIEKGEELFEDYGFWSDGGITPDHWLYRLYVKHHPGHLAFLSSLEPLKVAA